MKNFIFFKTKLQAVIFVIAFLLGLTSEIFAQANITVSSGTLNGFAYIVNNGPSQSQTFTVNGSNLTADIILTPSVNYEISTTLIGGFGSSITLAPSEGVVSDVMIYVRLKVGLIISGYIEDIMVTSNGATSKIITCSGNVNCIPSDLTFSLPEMTKTLDSPLFAQKVSSTNITPTVVYSSSNTDVATVNSEGEVTIGASTGQVTITASHEAGAGLCAGSNFYTLNVVQTPQITVTPVMLSGFSAVSGIIPSDEQLFLVGGSHLIDNVELTAPANYEISKVSGSAFVPSLTLTQVNGNIDDTYIYVRLKAGLPTTFYNNEVVAIVSTLAVPKSVVCSGSVSRAVTNLNIGLAVSKALDSPKFIRTATSLNTTTPITYGGSDDKVALVDAVTGEVTPVGLGEVVITASQIAGMHNSVEYLASSASYTLTVFLGAVVNVSTSLLSGFTYSAGAGPSVGQSFTVNGSNLTGEITLTAPANYEISTNSGSNFSGIINLNHVLGDVPATLIYVRLKDGLYILNYTEDILITSQDAFNKTVSCSGNVTCGISNLAFTETSVTKTVDDTNFIFQLSKPVGVSLVYSSLNPAVATVNEFGEVDILSEGSTEISVSHIAGAGLCAATTFYTLNVVKTPLVTASPAVLSGFTAVSGVVPSAEQVFAVEGVFLINNIELTAPANFEISTVSGSAFGPSLTLDQLNGTVASTNIYTRMKAGLPVADYNNESVTVVSALAAPKAVVCSGSMICAPSQLAFLVDHVDKTMGNAPFSIMPISDNGSSSIIYSSSSPTVATVNAITGEVTIVSEGETEITASQAGDSYNSVVYCNSMDKYTLTVAVGPTISVAPTLLGDLTYTAGSAAPEMSFEVSGTLLTNNILITAPSNFEISTGSGLLFQAANAITLTRTGSVVEPTIIYVRMKTLINVGAYSENITLTSTDAIAKSVACKGSVLCYPYDLDFGVTLVTKALGDAAFTETASTLRNAVINYTSSVPGVATVNSTSGLVTILSEGSTSITASQSEGGGYCGEMDTYTLNVGVPTITVAEALIPAMNCEVGATDTETITVNGTALTADIKVEVDNKSLFSISDEYLTQSGGIVLNKSVIITYNPMSIGISNAILTLSSDGAVDVILNLSGTATSGPVTNSDQISVDLKVSVVNGNLTILASDGERIDVFNAIGQKLISKLAVGGLNTIVLPVHGLVLVKVGSRVAKVIL